MFYNKMQIHDLVNTNIYDSDLIMLKNNDIALSSWMPDNNTLPLGVYDIFFLANHFTVEILISTVFYSSFSSPPFVWNRLLLKWNKLPDDIFDFGIIVKRHRTDNTLKSLKRSKRSITQTRQKWRFKLLSKKSSDNGIGIREEEDFEPTVAKCSAYIFTSGPERVFGANCPIDPDTSLEMDQCLNWRRTDDIGESCRGIMSTSDVSESITDFCNNVTSAQDCKCINREYYPEYMSQNVDRKNLHDSCWYLPCSSGSYLVENVDKPVKCGSTNCIVSYRNEEGNVDSKAKSMINCHKVALQSSTYIREHNDIPEFLKPTLEDKPNKPDKPKYFPVFIKRKEIPEFLKPTLKDQPDKPKYFPVFIKRKEIPEFLKHDLPKHNDIPDIPEFLKHDLPKHNDKPDKPDIPEFLKHDLPKHNDIYKHDKHDDIPIDFKPLDITTVNNTFDTLDYLPLLVIAASMLVFFILFRR